MHTTRIYIPALFFCVFCLSKSSARNEDNEDFKAIMEKVHTAYYDSSRELNYDVLIKYYEKNNLKKVVDSTLGQYSIWNENMICSMEGISTLISDDYYVSKLESRKKLIVGKNYSPYDVTFVLSKWDSIFDEKLMRVEMLKTDSNEVFYRVVNNNKNEIDSIDIKIDPQNFFLSLIIIYYDKNFRISKDDGYAPVLKFSYQNYRISPVDESIQKKYLISNYVIINKKNQVSASKTYSGYNIINNLKYQKQ